MTDELVRRRQWGDISFGMPKDIALLNKPFGFYEFLGVLKTATRDEIKTAYRKMALQFHPDRPDNKGREHFAGEQMKSATRVFDILYDNGGSLGEDHSQRKQYDVVSSLDEFFDGFVEQKGDRTKKLSEIMLIMMESKRDYAKAEQEIREKSPLFGELEQKLERARSETRKEEIREEMERVVAESKGMSEEQREKAKRRMEEMEREHVQRNKTFFEDLCEHPENYFSKVLDVWYLGGNITFRKPTRAGMEIGLANHQVRDHILSLVLAKECAIEGFERVHFKAPEADVTITDESITGIFHVIKGNVSVQYEGSTYGEVIRARAPNVRMKGFEQRGELFVPERFATQNWWRKNPALDIAVSDGTITLDLPRQKFSSTPNFYNLSRIISETIISYNSFEKISENSKYIINKKNR